MSFSEQDYQYMQQALGLARLAQPISMPNPAVGCVLVRDGLVIGQSAVIPCAILIMTTHITIGFPVTKTDVRPIHIVHFYTIFFF